MTKQAVILTSVGFAVGVMEALIYYNMGQSEGRSFNFKIPPSKEFLKTAGVVLITSLITTAIFNGIEMIYEPPKEQLASNDKT